MSRLAPSYQVDPLDPRAPSQSVWDALSSDERQRILDALPSELASAEPPEGDAHAKPKHQARSTLSEHFGRLGRRVYLASELPVYYPDEPVFAPDLLAVLDVEPHDRDHWTVSHEKRGLDFVLEVHVRGSAKKDFEDNVVRYARLGIPEYFAYAPRLGRLAGWHLPSPEARAYERVIPQQGRWRSQVLGLDLALTEGRLRFYYGSAILLDTEELLASVSAMLDTAVRRAEEEARRGEEEAQRAERYAARLRELGIDPEGES